MSEEQISDLRHKIDELDDKILDLIRQRMAVSAQVSKAKTDKSTIFRPAREAEIFADLSRKSAELPAHFVRGLWRVIISASIAAQKPDFTIASSVSAYPHALALSAGQLELLPKTEQPEMLIQKLQQGIADIILIARSEMAGFAPLIASSDKVHLIAEIPAGYARVDTGSAYILSSQPADRTDRDVALYYHHQTNQLCEYTAAQSNQPDTDENWVLLGFFVQFEA